MDSTYLSDRPLGYFQVAAGGINTAQSLSALAAAANVSLFGARMCLVTPEAQAVRWRDDGTNPTATVGYPLPVGAELQLTSSRLQACTFIAQTAGAILNVAVYG